MSKAAFCSITFTKGSIARGGAAAWVAPKSFRMVSPKPRPKVLLMDTALIRVPVRPRVFPKGIMLLLLRPRVLPNMAAERLVSVRPKVLPKNDGSKAVVVVRHRVLPKEGEKGGVWVVARVKWAGLGSAEWPGVVLGRLKGSTNGVGASVPAPSSEEALAAECMLAGLPQTHRQISCTWYGQRSASRNNKVEPFS